MESIGKNPGAVVERRYEPRKLVEGRGITIEHVPEGHVISCNLELPPKVNLAPLVENMEGMQSVVEAHGTHILAESQKLADLVKRVADLPEHSQEIKALLDKIKELEARPAQLVETKVIERPGMTMHELRVEYKTPRWVWVMLAVLLSNSIYMWFM